MKSTGIVRHVDGLGRVVIPMELRRTLDIEEKDPLEVFIDGDRIILRKYQPGCYLCSSTEGEMKHFYGRLICTKCIAEVAKYSNQIKEALANG